MRLGRAFILVPPPRNHCLVPPFRLFAPVQRRGQTIGGVGSLLALWERSQSSCGTRADHRESVFRATLGAYVRPSGIRIAIRQRLFS